VVVVNRSKKFSPQRALVKGFDQTLSRNSKNKQLCSTTSQKGKARSGHSVSDMSWFSCERRADPWPDQTQRERNIASGANTIRWLQISDSSWRLISLNGIFHDHQARQHWTHSHPHFNRRRILEDFLQCRKVHLRFLGKPQVLVSALLQLPASVNRELLQRARSYLRNGTRRHSYCVASWCTTWISVLIRCF